MDRLIPEQYLFNHVEKHSNVKCVNVPEYSGNRWSYIHNLLIKTFCNLSLSHGLKHIMH